MLPQPTLERDFIKKHIGKHINYTRLASALILIVIAEHIDPGCKGLSKQKLQDHKAFIDSIYADTCNAIRKHFAQKDRSFSVEMSAFMNSIRDFVDWSQIPAIERKIIGKKCIFVVNLEGKVKLLGILPPEFAGLIRGKAQLHFSTSSSSTNSTFPLPEKPLSSFESLGSTVPSFIPPPLTYPSRRTFSDSTTIPTEKVAEPAPVLDFPEENLQRPICQSGSTSGDSGLAGSDYNVTSLVSAFSLFQSDKLFQLGKGKEKRPYIDDANQILELNHKKPQ